MRRLRLGKGKVVTSVGRRQRKVPECGYVDSSGDWQPEHLPCRWETASNHQRICRTVRTKP